MDQANSSTREASSFDEESDEEDHLMNPSLYSDDCTDLHVFHSQVDMVDYYHGPLSLFVLCKQFRSCALSVSDAKYDAPPLRDILQSLCESAGVLEPFPPFGDQPSINLLPKQQANTVLSHFFQHVDCVTDIFVKSSLLAHVERIYSHQAGREERDKAAQQSIYHFNILPAIPLEGGATYTEISAKVGLSERKLKTVVRKAIINCMVRENAPEHVVHTASSALLLRNRNMMDYYGFFVEQMFPASAKLAEALEKYQDCAAAQDTAFDPAFNTNETLFKFLEQHPKLQARFVGAMESNIRPWAELGEATVIDVGGSSGFMSVELAQRYPNLKMVVEDYKNTVEQGAAQLPPELADRVKFVPHNLFDLQPVAGAEIYILHHICHDWSAENSVKIIKQILPAMKPGSKILLVEIVVSMLNAQERSESGWREIITRADSKLGLTHIITLHGSTDSIIEISLREN
ncbi:hypothetical protein UA08_06066 [Talaromyces atroroseus]|uniref:O-methyltransferase C-terminal domain-containing protein n=1 Tax=Talaromyces atroroseus TaxID=1441469 RepID=A0A225AS93_TALAT|nr:hypothetical protein UA08_06066 [Talaromyces atroroseus]OKL58469.1 hypothetical protein UA08_06066 [Talaromyces atroroseus]